MIKKCNQCTSCNITHNNNNSQAGKAVITDLVTRLRQGIGVRLLAKSRDFSLYHSNQTGSGAQPASYTMGTKGLFPQGKTATVRRRPLTNI
jgi:ADP-ribosylglycohydrolase